MSRTNPVTGGTSVSPDDVTDLPGGLTSCLWVGQIGSLSVVTKDGSELTFANASGWMPVQVVRVMETGTDATEILALYGSPG